MPVSVRPSTVMTSIFSAGRRVVSLVARVVPEETYCSYTVGATS